MVVWPYERVELRIVLLCNDPVGAVVSVYPSVFLSFAMKASLLLTVKSLTETAVGLVAADVLRSIFSVQEPATMALPAESVATDQIFSVAPSLPPNCRAQTYAPGRVSFTT